MGSVPFLQEASQQVVDGVRSVELQVMSSGDGLVVKVFGEIRSKRFGELPDAATKGSRHARALEQKSRVVDVFREIPDLKSFCSRKNITKEARILERHLCRLIGPGFFHLRCVHERPRKCASKRRRHIRSGERSQQRRSEGEGRLTEELVARLDQKQA